LQYIKNETQSNASNKSRFIYYQEGHPFILLNRGVVAFEECIEILNNTPPLSKLEFDPSLNILIPEDKSYWVKGDHLMNIVSLKKSELKNSEVNAFHFDIGTFDAEISLILQLVDDNTFNGIRRSNLLNEKFKYIGITHKKSDTICCSYFFFSDVLNVSN